MRTNNSIALDFKGIDLTGESLVLTGACDTMKRAHLASGFLICCGMLIAGVAGEACVCRYDLAITYTEPDTDDEEPEEICTAHIYACNGYDLTIVNDAVTAVAAPDAGSIDARVTALEGVVGDEDDGLVKDVIDLQGDVADLGGIVDAANDRIIIDEITSTGNSIAASKPIIESMAGYSAQLATDEEYTVQNVYTSVCKNGNKLTFVSALYVTKDEATSSSKAILYFDIPQDIYDRIYATTIGGYSAVAFLTCTFIDSQNTFKNIRILVLKGNTLAFAIYGPDAASLDLSTNYYVRLELTLLLSDNLITNP